MYMNISYAPSGLVEYLLAFPTACPVGFILSASRLHPST
jgi:hypothetical protein